MMLFLDMSGNLYHLFLVRKQKPFLVPLAHSRYAPWTKSGMVPTISVLRTPDLQTRENDLQQAKFGISADEGADVQLSACR